MIETDVNNIEIAPFLRWTGSKRWFTQEHLKSFLPKVFNSYYEPFLGGGAVFFDLFKNDLNNQISREYWLSDINEELINCYRQVKNNKTRLVSQLRELKNTESDYYKIRNEIPNAKISQAARFIYLNRTSFNGIYRVNSSGKYNVPYGKREKVDVITPELLNVVSKALKKVSITHAHFEDAIEDVKKNDLVFIDPPYTVAHENNGFIEYNQKLFSWDDQLRLRDAIKEIIARKAFFILTNASHDSIAELYKHVGKISKVSRPSKVGGRNKTRGLYNEFIIYNTVK